MTDEQRHDHEGDEGTATREQVLKSGTAKAAGVPVGTLRDDPDHGDADGMDGPHEAG